MKGKRQNRWVKEFLKCQSRKVENVILIVDVENLRHDTWENDWYECPNCLYDSIDTGFNYCPSCGEVLAFPEDDEE